MMDPAGNPSDDIWEILARWPWTEEGTRVRVLRGADGLERLQVRLECGLLQFEVAGRPDGVRPSGSESLCDALKAQGRGVGAIAAEQVRQECDLYEQRARAWLVLGECARAAADCDRNVQALDWALGQVDAEVEPAPLREARLNALLLRARAEVTACARAGDARGGLAAIDRALGQLERMQEGVTETGYGQAMLRAMRDTLLPRLPSSQRADLEERLRRAIRSENFELAALLRNELRQIRE